MRTRSLQLEYAWTRMSAVFGSAMNSRAIQHEPDITKAAGPGLIAGVFLLGMASVAMSQTPALLQKSTEAAEIATLSQRDGFVRVIVRFVSPVPANTIKPDP